MKIIRQSIILIICSVLLPFATMAQVDKTIHQTFTIDSVAVVQFDIVGEYEFVKWAGNTILTETYVVLENAKPEVLKYVIEEGRYQIESFNNGTSVTLNSTMPIRKKVRTKNGECEEKITIKIFIPDDFNIVNLKQIVRVETKKEE